MEVMEIEFKKMEKRSNFSDLNYKEKGDFPPFISERKLDKYHTRENRRYVIVSISQELVVLIKAV